MSKKSTKPKRKKKMGSTKGWAKKISVNRGDKWKKNLRAGRLDAQLNPSFIRLARLKKSIKQEEIADKLKLSESTYGSIERGKRPVKKEAAVKIAGMLNKPVDRLFKSKGKNKFVAVIRTQSI